jgi:hypothetical protein
MAVNWKRVHLGTVAGGVVWSVWSLVINTLAGGAYEAAQAAGTVLEQPRYTVGGFLAIWFVVLFALAAILSWLYANLRGPQGPGPGTALKIGFMFGFAITFPLSWSMTNWLAVSRMVPLWWTLDLWVGAVLAALVAGWVYRD